MRGRASHLAKEGLDFQAFCRSNVTSVCLSVLQYARTPIPLLRTLLALAVLNDALHADQSNIGHHDRALITIMNLFKICLGQYYMIVKTILC